MTDAQILRLVSRGLTPTQAADYYMVEHAGLDYKEAARVRGTKKWTIQKSVRRAQCVLDEEDT